MCKILSFNWGVFTKSSLDDIASELKKIVNGIQILGKPIIGGQKIVFPIDMEGKRLALKVILLENSTNDDSIEHTTQNSPPSGGEVMARAKREVSILSEVNIPELAALGPIPLTEVTIFGNHVLFYSEDWVNGETIKDIIEKEGRLPPEELVRLGIDVATAIDWLSNHSMIHRDIKPGNIVRRGDGKYILFDLGVALDLEDDSLTIPGFTVGTMPYLSPEQLDLPRKRSIDYRSDMYSLGITMYEGATGEHPYYRQGMSSTQTIMGIQSTKPTPPAIVIDDFPIILSTIIMRLIEKSPHLRYRTCSKLIDALKQSIPEGGIHS